MVVRSCSEEAWRLDGSEQYGLGVFLFSGTNVRVTGMNRLTSMFNMLKYFAPSFQRSPKLGPLDLCVDLTQLCRDGRCRKDIVR